jgi:hypothetical protein
VLLSSLSNAAWWVAAARVVATPVRASRLLQPMQFEDTSAEASGGVDCARARTREMYGSWSSMGQGLVLKANAERRRGLPVLEMDLKLHA